MMMHTAQACGMGQDEAVEQLYWDPSLDTSPAAATPNAAAWTLTGQITKGAIDITKAIVTPPTYQATGAGGTVTIRGTTATGATAAGGAVAAGLSASTMVVLGLGMVALFLFAGRGR